MNLPHTKRIMDPNYRYTPKRILTKAEKIEKARKSKEDYQRRKLTK